MELYRVQIHLDRIFKLLAMSNPAPAPEIMEKHFFKKEEGHYYFTVTQSTVRSGGAVMGMQ